MKIFLKPSIVNGHIVAPASKSAMQRACAAALIRGGETRLVNPGVSDDDNAALGIIEGLGASVSREGGEVIVRSEGISRKEETIDCGESGLSVRLFTSLAACIEGPVRLTGHGSLTRRPLHFFDEVLPQLGVRCASQEGRLPLEVAGPLQPRDIRIDGSLSSQFLTGLLFAYAARGAAGVTISVDHLNSKPYVDLTLEILEAFGLPTPVNRQYESFVYPANGERKVANGPLRFEVEGDWSGAAFLLVAGAISGEVCVSGINAFSSQADKAILQALMQASAVMSIEEKQVTVRPGRLQAFQFNATDCPDLFPPLVALAACCEGKSVIEGVHRLTHKESNRSLTLQEEFGKMGVAITLQDDLMIIEGGEGVTGGEVHAQGDHRIAMATAVAALRASGETVISNAEAVGKSYPGFWQDLSRLGAQLQADDKL
jgi:3-phosphoshikimate 1-carboxyvinyltransferase